MSGDRADEEIVRVGQADDCRVNAARAVAHLQQAIYQLVVAVMRTELSPMVTRVTMNEAEREIERGTVRIKRAFAALATPEEEGGE